MHANQIFLRLRAVYADFETYTDSGQVVWGNDRVEFSTFFKKPSQLQFKWSGSSYVSGEPPRISREPVYGVFIAKSDGEHHALKSCSETQFRPADHAHKAFNTGIHFRCALSSCALLLPNLIKETYNLSELANLRLIDDGVLQSTECYRLVGSLQSKEDTELWISKSNYFLMRCRQKNWFNELINQNPAEDLPDNNELPFSTDCMFQSITPNEPLQNEAML